MAKQVRNPDISPQREVQKTALPNEGTALNLNAFEGRVLKLEAFKADLTVGSADEVTSGAADLTSAQLQTQLNADSIAANTTIGVLKGTHAFTGNVDVQSDGIVIFKASQHAIFDMATNTFTVSANNVELDLIFDNVVSNGLIFTGTGGVAYIETLNALSGSDTPISSTTAGNRIFWNDNLLLTTGVIELGIGTFIPAPSRTNQVQMYVEDLTAGDAALVIRSEDDTEYKFGSKMTHAGDIEPTVDSTLDIGTASLKYNEMFAVTFNGEATSALYADLAEKYTNKDGDQPEGTLVSVCEDDGFDIEVTKKDNCIRVLGVVSAKPGFLLNKECAGQPVARIGICNIRIDGPILKGGLVIASELPGVARSAKYTYEYEMKIAFALEEHLESGEKLVRCVI